MTKNLPGNGWFEWWACWKTMRSSVKPSGQEAILSTTDLQPDIVLLDIRMPGMDGLHAGNELANLPYPPAVVYCTAFGEHAIEAFDVNAAGYLLKPVRAH